MSIVRLATDSQAGNVLSMSVEIEANIRTLSRETLELVQRELPALAIAIGTAHGCRVESEFIASYPVTYNDPAETEQIIGMLAERHGADRVVRLPAPSMASEDFAYILEEVPGTLVFLGARPDGVADADAPAMHSDRAVFDDAVLAVPAATLAEIAWRRLIA